MHRDHDPLCGAGLTDWDYGWCLCEIFEAVRQDERESIQDWGVKQSSKHISWILKSMSDRDAAYERGRSDVLNALFKLIKSQNGQRRRI